MKAAQLKSPITILTQTHRPAAKIPSSPLQPVSFSIPDTCYPFKPNKTLSLSFCRNVSSVVGFSGVWVFLIWEGFAPAGGEKGRAIHKWFEVSAFLASVAKTNQFSLQYVPGYAFPYNIQIW